MTAPEDLTELPVEFLLAMHLRLAPARSIAGGPHGTRVFVAVLGGTVLGPRIRAEVQPGGADWVTVRDNGIASLDVRLTMQTDDGAVVYMEYGGILDVGQDRLARTAPRFQASHEAYLWLNDLQAVGIGTPGSDEVTYQVYALV